MVYVPFERINCGCTRLGIFLPNFINSILKNSSNLNFNDFFNSLRKNIIIMYTDKPRYSNIPFSNKTR